MLRRSLPYWCSYASTISPASRVGIFPLHLDPPTLQHQQIFRLLLDLEEDEGGHHHPSPPKQQPQPATKTPGAGSSHSNRNGDSNTSSSSGSGLYVPPSFSYLTSFARSLRQDSQLAPFDDLILVPNTRYPVSLRQSTHLAALAVLATRGLPHVHIDFTALEHPDESMPVISELCYMHPNAALVHWLHDAYEMQSWRNFSDIKMHVPLLLLQTTSYPPAALSQRYEENYKGIPSVLYSKLYQVPEETASLSDAEQRYYTKVQTQLHRMADYRCNRHLHLPEAEDTAHGSSAEDEHQFFYPQKQPPHNPEELYSSGETVAPAEGEEGGEAADGTEPPAMHECVRGRWWRTHGGRGDDAVEISRSYAGSAGISWLGISYEEEGQTEMASSALLESLARSYYRHQHQHHHSHSAATASSSTSAVPPRGRKHPGAANSSSGSSSGRTQKDEPPQHQQAIVQSLLRSRAQATDNENREDIQVSPDGSLEFITHSTSGYSSLKKAMQYLSGSKRKERVAAAAVEAATEEEKGTAAAAAAAATKTNVKEVLSEFKEVRKDLENLVNPQLDTTNTISADRDKDDDDDDDKIKKDANSRTAVGTNSSARAEKEERKDKKKEDDNDDDDEDDEDDEKEDIPESEVLRTYHSFAPRNVSQLIEELYPPNTLYVNHNNNCSYHHLNTSMMSAAEVTAAAAAQAAAAAGERMEEEESDDDALMSPQIPMVEVHPVVRTTGADVRHALWERELDPKCILSDCVQRYISSHGLYQDSRKTSASGGYRAAGGGSSSAAANVLGGAVGALVGGGATIAGGRRGLIQKDSTVMSFPGVVPRLELHYDKNNLLAREQYEKLKLFQCQIGEEPDLIVPIGGDGYMMHCIRRNWDRFIPFYGVNAGHVGYLLNDCATLEELFSSPLKLHSTTMLYCQAEQESEMGERVLLSELAFNDAWVERASGQTALIRILVNGEERIRRLRGDGVLVSTAAGSTAYSQALGASPVPVGAPLIQVVGSNVVSPAQWRPAHLEQEDQVEFEVIDSVKRPCRCYVDSVDMGIVTRLTVRSSRVAGVTLAFSKSCDLQHKLYQMQFPNTL